MDQLRERILEAQLKKYSDMPVSYQRQGLADPNTGLLKKQFNLSALPAIGMTSNLDELKSRLGGINLNTQGLEAIRSRALQTGMSPWANMMMERQGVEEAGARDTTTKSNARAGVEAMNDLAMRGGLSGGARERLALQTKRGGEEALQGVARQGMLDRLGIQTTDEDKKTQMLMQLPGMEVQALQPELQKTSMWQSLADSESGRKADLDIKNRAYQSEIEKINIANALGEKKAADEDRLRRYEEQMKTWAANKQAEATANSGGKK